MRIVDLAKFIISRPFTAAISVGDGRFVDELIIGAGTCASDPLQSWAHFIAANYLGRSTVQPNVRSAAASLKVGVTGTSVASY